jgi:hypothetical protein
MLKLQIATRNIISSRTARYNASTKAGSLIEDSHRDTLKFSHCTLIMREDTVIKVMKSIMDKKKLLMIRNVLILATIFA